jgi:DNA ligase (NAD+)
MKSIDLLTQSLTTFLDKKTSYYRFFYDGGNVAFKLRPTDDHTMILHNLRAEPVGQGMGDQTMYTLGELADQAQVTLKLTANPSTGSRMRLPQLQQWYTKHGFVFDRNSRTMVRLPTVGKPRALIQTELDTPTPSSTTDTKVTPPEDTKIKTPTVAKITSTSTIIKWSVIDKDPNKWSLSVDDKTLSAVIKKAATYYFEGNPKLSDKSFDILEKNLRDRQPNNPVLTQVGTTPIKGKVPLPFRMPSLDKVRKDMDTLSKWTAKFKPPYLLMDKLDGNSVLLDARDVRNPKLYTRGDGNVGQDISHLLRDIRQATKKESYQDVSSLLKHLRLNITEPFVARGEIILPTGVFDKYKQASDNPESFNLRNFIAGQINRKNKQSEAMVDAKIVFYELIEPKIKPSEQLHWLKQQQLNVVAHKSVKEIDDDMLINILAHRVTASRFEIDGLVIVQDSAHPRAEENPDYAFAYKSMLESDMHDVLVTGVEWNASRHGKLKPVILIEPTKMCGAIISRVTAHNAKVIVDNKIGRGTIVRVCRSGGVIPYLVTTVKPTEPELPVDIDCEWNSTGVDLYLVESTDTDDELRVKSIAHFFTSIGVEGLREATVQKLYDCGLDSVKKVVNAQVSDFLEVPSFQEKSAQKLFSNIKAATSNLSLAHLMSASMMFGEGFSKKRCQLLTGEFSDILSWLPKEAKSNMEKVMQVPGFSDKLASQFINQLPTFVEFYLDLGLTPALEQTKNNPIGTLLAGQFIVMTGFRNTEMTTYIEQQGGEVVDSINRATMLIVKDINAGSSKIRVAQSKGIPILNIDDWSEKFNFGVYKI